VNHYRSLVVVAMDLATTKAPSEAALRRSLSTLYYACFHRAMQFVADTLAPGAVGSPAWTKLYRALDHRPAKNRLALISENIPTLSPFSQLFGRLLDERQRADYDPAAFDLDSREMLSLIQDVVIAMGAFDTLTQDQRLEVAVALLLPERKEDSFQRRS
jgi:hypothetical protein